MTATLGTYGLVRSTETFDTLNPATGEVIGTYPVFSEQDVADTVERARRPRSGGLTSAGLAASSG